VTRPATDDVGHGTPGRAKKRTKDLLRDAWGVREVEGGWLIRAPMDQHWQRWEPMDKEWSVMVEWRATEKP
jgi:hypothetical protein